MDKSIIKRKESLNILSNIPIVEKITGDNPGILVRNNEENRQILEDLGVSEKGESEEIILKYGDFDTFCLLNLAIGEGLAKGYIRNRFTMENLIVIE